MDIKKSPCQMTVTTPFWKVVLNTSKGGCIEDINFPNGSGRNILIQPIYTRVDGYYDVNDGSITYDLSQNGREADITIKGELKDGDSRYSGIGFTHRYVFKEEYIKVLTELHFGQDFDVKEVEIGSACLKSRLCHHVCRPPAEEDHSWMNFSASHAVKIEKAGEEISKYKNVPLNCYFYDIYVEGIDFEPDSDVYKWDGSFSKDNGRGLYYVKKTASGIYLRRSPFTAENPERISKGVYSFGYYIGLPKIYDKVPRKWHFISVKTWPTDKQIDMWAEAGINLLKLHNDFSDDGVYWRDGCYPPYDEHNMSEMRRVIAAAHRNSMKVMLYFSLYELHPEAPGFENTKQWCREPIERKDSLWWKLVKDGAIYNPAGSGLGYFGAQMCLMSGWMDKLKANIKKAYKDLEVDGIYFDYVTNSFCGNRHHYACKHTTIDGVIAMLEWTRRLIGKDGVLALHIQSSNPSIVFENFADMVITLEELAYLETGDEKEIIYRMPEVNELPAFSVEGEVVQRSICHSIVDRMNDSFIAAKRFIAMCASFGFLNYMDNFCALKYVNDLKKIDILDFRFKNIFSGIVETSSPDVKGSVYFNEKEAVIFVINLSGQYLYDVDVKLNTEKIGWEACGNFTITANTIKHASEPLVADDLKKPRRIGRIEPYEYIIFTLKTICEMYEKYNPL